MIKEIFVKGARFINVPANMNALVELGLSVPEAESKLQAHYNEAKSIEAHTQRKLAYFQLSDPLFMEAIRKDAAGDIEGAQAARTQALQAVADIKAKYPLPEVDA